MIMRLGIVTLLITLFALSFAMMVRHNRRVLNPAEQVPCAQGTDTACGLSRN
jgi:hypothetical protein